jgi:two-component system, NarL family, nitrate/nitrite response regulator NarL
VRRENTQCCPIHTVVPFRQDTIELSGRGNRRRPFEFYLLRLRGGPGMPSIFSVVVHASRMFREGVKSILTRTPFEPACTVASPAEVPSHLPGTDDQIMAIIGAPTGCDIAQAVSTTKGRFPDAHVVVIGDATDTRSVVAALEADASSFLDENMDAAALIKVLELVALGEPVVSVDILRDLLGTSAPVTDEVLEANDTAANEEQQQPRPPLGQPPPSQKAASMPPRLSSREVAILDGLVQGAPNKVIAHQLKITEATVKVHVKAILRKIRVRNRTQAAIWAMSRQPAPKNGAEDRFSSRSNGASNLPLRRIEIQNDHATPRVAQSRVELA